MPVIDGIKYSCEPCMRGHRSTKCQHQDRLLVRVRRPGRPLSSCPHPTSQKGTGFHSTSSFPATPIENGVNSASKNACGCHMVTMAVAIPKASSCQCCNTEPNSAVKPCGSSHKNGHNSTFNPSESPATQIPSASIGITPHSLIGNGGGRVSKINTKKRRSIIEQPTAKLRSPTTTYGDGTSFYESLLNEFEKPHDTVKTSNSGSCCGGKVISPITTSNGQNGHHIMHQIDTGDVDSKFGLTARLDGSIETIPIANTGSVQISPYQSNDYGILWQSQWKFPQAPDSIPSGGCCGSGKPALDTGRNELPSSDIQPDRTHLGHFNSAFNHLTSTGLPGHQHLNTLYNADFQLPVLDSNPFPLPISGAMENYSTTSQKLPENHHKSAIDEHVCTCGPSCNCLGCVAHPYNPRTLEFVDSVRDLVDYQSPNSETAETQRDASNGDEQSPSSFQNSPITEEISSNAYFHVEYPSFSGACYCEDGCQCISCWGCFERNSLQKYAETHPSELLLDAATDSI